MTGFYIDLLSWKTYAVPLIGGFIGWLTNYIAVKMLFHPRQPKKVLFLTFHGIFPKNKPRIANKLGNVVQRDLINFNDIKERLQDPEALNNIKEEIALRIDNVIRDKVEKNPVAKTLVPEGLIQSVHKSIVKEIENNLPQVIGTSLDKIEEKLDIRTLVRNKVEAFSDEKLENMLMDITAREFKFIELIGAILGFLIGIVQLIIQSF
ncbi:MAG: DUF445 family protein [Chitinophagales bacterium]|nr:DUF445 family protein [Chitinophagales bacterium]